MSSPNPNHDDTLCYCSDCMNADEPCQGDCYEHRATEDNPCIACYDRRMSKLDEKYEWEVSIGMHGSSYL